MKLLFATGNSHKLAEVRGIAPGVEWLSIADFPQLVDLNPEETGKTFEENAILKARAYGIASGVPTVAEDSGLVVDALNGEPGVRSARWVPGTDQDRYTELLSRLKNAETRTARFVTVACFFDPQTQETKCFQGEVEGSIGWEARGNQGFGYDPVFIPEGFHQTFGELGVDVKSTMSHRARALQPLVAWLSKRGL